METLSILSGIMVTARALLEGLMKMDVPLFEKTIADIVVRGDNFSKQDDTAYTATLSEDETTMYAAHVRFFLEALNDLKAVDKKADRLTRAAKLANAIALWHSLDMFKTMSGISVED